MAMETGVKDSGGRIIREGDFAYFEGRPWIVFWRKSHCGFYLSNVLENPDDQQATFVQLTESVAKDCNIHGNKNEGITMKSFTAEDHKVAQVYEQRFAKGWMDEYMPAIFDELDRRDGARVSDKAPGCPDYFRIFFAEDPKLWNDFCDHVENRKSLEIAPGPAGALALWTWIKGQAHFVDPSIGFYIGYQDKTFRRSVYSNYDLFFEGGADHHINGIDGQIDGCIVSSNSLDHFEKPFLALENISRYAAPGCILLHWSETRHLRGADEGHCDVCERPEMVKEFLLNHGWKLIRECPTVQPDWRQVEEWGGVLVKM